MNFISEESEDGNSEEDKSEAIEKLDFQIAVDNLEWQVELAECNVSKSSKKNTRQVKKNITSLDVLK